MKTISLLGVLVIGCGGAVSDGATIPGQPPSPPSASETVPASSTTKAFIVDHWLLGDAPRDGSAPSITAWRTFGYDLDRRATTTSSSDVCARTNGAPLASQVDGDDGIDNAWGATLVPVFESALTMPTMSDSSSFALAKGATPLVLEVTGLPADPSASATGLTMSTSFDDAASHFAAAYVNHGTFVSGAGDVPLGVGIPFVVGPTIATLPLVVHDAVITFASNADGTIAGTLAGVLDVTDVDWATTTFALTVAPTVFGGNPQNMDGLRAQLAQAADILVDGTNKAGVPCSGISIGIGFTAHAAP